MPDDDYANNQHELWMEEALREAQAAGAAGEVPIGAVVVFRGRIIARGSNRVIRDSDPTAHAEVVALRNAGRAVENYRLLECTLYVTIEPCVMCAGALVHSRIDHLVYGADDAKAGAVHSIAQIVNHPALNHTMQVTSGILAGRCRETVQSFFRDKRALP